MAAAQAEGPAGCTKDGLILPAVMMMILYFVWLRPATKERKTHAAMIEALKRGDEVITASGVLGKVADIQDSIVSLEVARNVKIRVLKSTVSKRLKDVESEKSTGEKPAEKSSSKSS